MIMQLNAAVSVLHVDVANVDLEGPIIIDLQELTIKLDY